MKYSKIVDIVLFALMILFIFGNSYASEKNTQDIARSIVKIQKNLETAIINCIELQKPRQDHPEKWDNIRQRELALVLRSVISLGSLLDNQREQLKYLQSAAEDYYCLGLLQEIQLELEKAITYYRQALEIDPDHKKAEVNLNELLKKQKN